MKQSKKIFKLTLEMSINKKQLPTIHTFLIEMKFKQEKAIQELKQYSTLVIIL